MCNKVLTSFAYLSCMEGHPTHSEDNEGSSKVCPRPASSMLVLYLYQSWLVRSYPFTKIMIIFS